MSDRSSSETSRKCTRVWSTSRSIPRVSCLTSKVTFSSSSCWVGPCFREWRPSTTSPCLNKERRSSGRIVCRICRKNSTRSWLSISDTEVTRDSVVTSTRSSERSLSSACCDDTIGTSKSLTVWDGISSTSNGRIDCSRSWACSSRMIESWNWVGVSIYCLGGSITVHCSYRSTRTIGICSRKNSEITGSNLWSTSISERYGSGLVCSDSRIMSDRSSSETSRKCTRVWSTSRSIPRVSCLTSKVTFSSSSCWVGPCFREWRPSTTSPCLNKERRSSGRIVCRICRKNSTRSWLSISDTEVTRDSVVTSTRSSERSLSSACCDDTIGTSKSLTVWDGISSTSNGRIDCSRSWACSSRMIESWNWVGVSIYCLGGSSTVCRWHRRTSIECICSGKNPEITGSSLRDTGISERYGGSLICDYWSAMSKRSASKTCRKRTWIWSTRRAIPSISWITRESTFSSTCRWVRPWFRDWRPSTTSPCL